MISRSFSIVSNKLPCYGRQKRTVAVAAQGLHGSSANPSVLAPCCVFLVCWLGVGNADFELLGNTFWGFQSCNCV